MHKGIKHKDEEYFEKTKRVNSWLRNLRNPSLRWRPGLPL